MSVVNVNTAAFGLARALDRTQAQLGQSLSRLSSGDRINQPSDDPKGLAMASKIDAQTRRNQAASENVQNAMSYTQSADGFLRAMTSVVTRMVELVTLAGNPLQNAGDSALYKEEFRQLQQQLRETIGGTTAEIGGTADIGEPIGRFNGRILFGGGSGLQLNVGVTAEETFSVAPVNLRAGAMGALIGQDGTGQFTLDLQGSGAAGVVSGALAEISTLRAGFGAYEGRLTLIAKQLVVEGQNLEASVSRIRDTDVARETTQMTKFKLLTETSTAMLAQSNQSPRGILRLLQD